MDISFMMILAYLTIGATVGWIGNLIFKERGVKPIPSILIGATGGFAGAMVFRLFDLAGSGLFAAVAAFLFLFTVNTFRKKKPIFQEPEV